MQFTISVQCISEIPIIIICLNVHVIRCLIVYREVNFIMRGFNNYGL